MVPVLFIPFANGNSKRDVVQVLAIDTTTANGWNETRKSGHPDHLLSVRVMGWVAMTCLNGL